MTNQHIITVPPELAQKCWDELRNQTQLLDSATGWDKAIALAYQAGADMELEACCREVQTLYSGGSRLRARRRPKPPSLKERSLQLLETYNTSGVMLTADQVDTIKRALEALDD
jgi:hypothetical protein